MENNQWAHRMIDLISKPDFYGEITLSVHSGQVRKITRLQSFIAPDIEDQRKTASQKVLDRSTTSVAK